MQLSDMRTTLRSKILNPTTTDVPDSTLNRLLNEAHREICDRYRFNGLRVDASTSIVAGTSSVSDSLFANLSYILQVRVVDSVNSRVGVLTKRDRAWFDAIFHSTEGFPTDYFHESGAIYINPLSDDAYTLHVRYVAYPADMVNDSDLPAIPTMWHDGIILRARYKYFDEVGNLPMSQYTFRAWSEWADGKASEWDEENKADWDMPVTLPTIQTTTTKLDFDHSD